MKTITVTLGKGILMTVAQCAISTVTSIRMFLANLIVQGSARLDAVETASDHLDAGIKLLRQTNHQLGRLRSFSRGVLRLHTARLPGSYETWLDEELLKIAEALTPTLIYLAAQVSQPARLLLDQQHRAILAVDSNLGKAMKPGGPTRLGILFGRIAINLGVVADPLGRGPKYQRNAKTTARRGEQRLTVPLPDEVAGKIKKHAERNGTSASKLGLLLVEHGLRRMKLTEELDKRRLQLLVVELVHLARRLFSFRCVLLRAQLEDDAAGQTFRGTQTLAKLKVREAEVEATLRLAIGAVIRMKAELGPELLQDLAEAKRHLPAVMPGTNGTRVSQDLPAQHIAEYLISLRFLGPDSRAPILSPASTTLHRPVPVKLHNSWPQDDGRTR